MSSTTITAVATPPGRGGIAIIRVSGTLVPDIMRGILGRELAPRQATHLNFLASDNSTIDEGIAIYFAAPNSFTGEDVLELQGHGSPVIADMLLQRLLELGAVLARPGEFSERAFLNGQLDLAQAEAIADLIDASSKQAARSAMRSLQGEFSQEVHLLNEKIIHLRMYIEAAIDFSDEEIDFLADEKIMQQAHSIKQGLTTIQKKAKQGSMLREGITAVIIGEPNVGKSSLLNALSGKELAIVTDIPGTTRDVLRDYILIDGMPMHIVDTAGLRESSDVVEQEGIRRARVEMTRADLVILVSDTNDLSNLAAGGLFPDGTAPAIDKHIPVLDGLSTILQPLSLINHLTEQQFNAPIISVINKIDTQNLLPAIKIEEDKCEIYLSAKTGAGLDLLKQRIKQTMGFTAESDGIYLARRRHLDALKRAEDHVAAALMQLTNKRAGELAAEDLRQAHLALCDITGEFTADDLLGKIFSSFCIGK